MCIEAVHFIKPKHKPEQPLSLQCITIILSPSSLGTPNAKLQGELLKNKKGPFSHFCGCHARLSFHNSPPTLALWGPHSVEHPRTHRCAGRWPDHSWGRLAAYALTLVAGDMCSAQEACVIIASVLRRAYRGRAEQSGVACASLDRLLLFLLACSLAIRSSSFHSIPFLSSQGLF